MLFCAHLSQIYFLFTFFLISDNTVNEAIKEAGKNGKEIFIIGGQKIFEQTFALAVKLEITYIDRDYEGDVYFPEIKKDEWKEVKREDRKTDEAEFSFVRYERIKNDAKNKNGIFIAFEGIDGCGKSTQIKKLTQYIFEKSKHNHIMLTRNPYKNANIRAVLTQDTDPHSQAEKLAELFINDRFAHAEDILKPSIEKGHFVLSDRFKLSTIAYQSAQGLDINRLIERHEGLPVPDMTFIVDVSPEVARERMQKEDASVRGKEHKFEAHLDFASKVRENYLKAAEIMKNRGEKVYIVNGERNPDEIFGDIKNIFESVIGNRNG